MTLSSPDESFGDGRLPRRRFLGWIATIAAGTAGLLGASVGYSPSAVAVTNCIRGTKYVPSGSCTNPGIGQCVGPGGYSCVDVCNGNTQCVRNVWLQAIRIKCTCNPPECCAQWC